MSKAKDSDIPIYRIVVLGTEGVGKTALINRYVNNYFSGEYKPTE